MIVGLRIRLERPLAEEERRRAFALAAAALVVAAIALSLVADPPSPDRPAAPSASSRVPPPASEARPTASAAPADVLGVARGFVAGYLRHLYGRGRASAIRHASSGLRQRLAANAPRVSRGMRERRPAVQRLRATALGGRWLVTATVVDDARVSYPVAVVVAEQPGGPVVTRVVED